LAHDTFSPLSRLFPDRQSWQVENRLNYSVSSSSSGKLMPDLFSGLGAGHSGTFPDLAVSDSGKEPGGALLL
tara:strand:+ start:4236 stop:4451 length:216 start_codon:yes stop_codon:yes gene_type:complete